VTDPRSAVPALAAALNRAIAENRLPNRYSPAELESWSGIPAAAINTVGLLWLGDLIEAMDRDDVDVMYHSGYFTVKEQR
jgi:hypothetical protein